MTDDKTTFYVALFGRCHGSTGPGSYAAAILNTRTGEQRDIDGRAETTTANRMELTAAVRALESLQQFDPGESVTVGTCSEYVIKGMREWLPGWKAKGWRTASRKPVQNADLWQELDAAAGRYGGVRWELAQRTYVV
jgi:ribonuclease HI